MATQILPSIPADNWYIASGNHSTWVGPCLLPNIEEIMDALHKTTGDYSWHCRHPEGYTRWNGAHGLEPNSLRRGPTLLKYDILRLVGPLLSVDTRKAIGDDGWYLVAPGFTAAIFVGSSDYAKKLAANYREATGNSGWSA